MTVRKAAEREGVLHPVSFRATTDLREKLAKAASEAGRSLTQEIERRLERSFDHDELVGSYMNTLMENAQLQAEVEDLKSAGPNTSDLEGIVERAVARALEQVLSPNSQESERPRSEIKLSERERNIFDLLVKNAPNWEIAQKLGIPEEALKAEIVTILKKMKVAYRADFEHEAQQYQAKPKTARKAPAQAKSKA
jgi:DNA-binding NarL/FixJ family response regulator